MKKTKDVDVKETEKRLLFRGQTPGPAAVPTNRESIVTARRIFLISPANASGRRARTLVRENATFALARRLRDGGAPLGEVFSFMSSLYFRGKLAYAQTFATAEPESSSIWIITPSDGLQLPEVLIDRESLRNMAHASVEIKNPEYRLPLERTARALQKKLHSSDEVVLLGSIASPKYVEPLLQIFGSQLLFPAEFVGRGDMSRGGLLLRHSQQRQELHYISVGNSVLRGTRPPKLHPQSKEK